MRYFNKSSGFLYFVVILSLTLPATGSDDDSTHGEVLNFGEKTLTDRDIGLLKSTDYEEIDLGHTNIKKHGLECIKAGQDVLKLKDLNVEGNGLDETDVEKLTVFKNLQVLNAADNRFKDSDLRKISSSLINLRDLNIQYNFVTSEGIQYLTKLNHLKSLDCGFMDLGNKAVSYISQLKSLEYLFIRSINIDGNSLKHFLSMPNLKWIDLSYNGINDKELTDFKLAMDGKEVIAEYLNTEKKFLEDFQHLSLSQKNKSSDPFQEATRENLKKLVSLLNNSKKHIGYDTRYEGISEKNLSNLCGYNSRTPVRKLLGRKEGNIEQETFLNIWKKLTGNFEQICKQYGLDKTIILNRYTENT